MKNFRKLWNFLIDVVVIYVIICAGITGAFIMRTVPGIGIPVLLISLVWNLENRRRR
jgi:hypothetical protein